jgi:hypothetical protein
LANDLTGISHYIIGRGHFRMVFAQFALELSFIDSPREEYITSCVRNTSVKRKLTKEIPVQKPRKWRTKGDVADFDMAFKFIDFNLAKEVLLELRGEKIEGDTPNHGNWIMIGVPHRNIEWVLKEEGKENYFATNSNNYLAYFSRDPRDVVVPFFGKLLFTPCKEKAAIFSEKDTIKFLYLLESIGRALPKRVFNVEVSSTWYSGYFGLSPTNFLLQRVFRVSSLSEVLLPDPEEDPFLRFPLPPLVEEASLVAEKEEQKAQSTSPAFGALSLPSHQTSVEEEENPFSSLVPSSSPPSSHPFPLDTYFPLLEGEAVGYPLGLEEELRSGPSYSYSPWNGLGLELEDLDDTSSQSFFPFHSSQYL